MQPAGGPSESELREAARALVRGHLENARGEEGRGVVAALEACGPFVETDLVRKARAGDELGATAALAWLARRGPGTPFEVPEGAQGAAWEAVRARTLTRTVDEDARHARLGAADSRVRRAAVDACAAIASASDREPLLLMAEHDPAPALRVAAIEALTPLTDERVVERLAELWGRAEPEVRDAIARLWASPKGLRAGGREHLITLLTSEPRPQPAVASALLEARGAGSALARQRLRQGAREGSTEERLASLDALSPEDADGELWDAAVTSGEPSLQLAVLRKRLLVPSLRVAALEQLRGLATRPTAEGRGARLALAAVGEDSVREGLVKDLSAPEPDARLQAALALLALHAWSAAAPALVDEDTRVALTVACHAAQ